MAVVAETRASELLQRAFIAARRLLGDNPDADDAASEAVLSLLQQRPGHVRSESAWLTRTVRNAVFRMWRDRKDEETAKRRYAVEMARDVWQEATIDIDHLHKQTSFWCRHVAGTLLFDKRVRDLAATQGRTTPTYRDAASVLGCSVATVSREVQAFKDALFESLI